MNEDVEIAKLVKGALEESVAVSGQTLRVLERFAEQEVRARRRRRLAWLGGSSVLAAASLTMVLLWGHVFSVGSKSVDLSGVREVIGLLCAADGLDDNLTSFAPAEMLLAWQDAPCADLL